MVSTNGWRPAKRNDGRPTPRPIPTPTPGERGPVGPVGPQGPQGLKGDPGEVDYDKVTEIVTNAVDKLRNDPALKGPKGDTGEKGDKGDPADIDISEVLRQLPPVTIKTVDRHGNDVWVGAVHLGESLELPPIHPQWIDNDGKVIDSIPGGVALGQTMPLRLNVVIKEALKQAKEESDAGPN